MKIILFIATLFFFSISKTFSQDKDVEAIKKLNNDWLHSYITKDSATLKKILADDFIMINPAGVKQTKADNITNLLMPNMQTTSVDFESVEVRLLTPDVGLLTAYCNFNFKYDGKEMSGKNCYQDVYVKRNGKWVAVAAHVTVLNK